MLLAKNLPYHFWAEATNTTCHIHNRVTNTSGNKATSWSFRKDGNPMLYTSMSLIESATSWKIIGKEK